jgi:hypothetical protein
MCNKKVEGDCKCGKQVQHIDDLKPILTIYKVSTIGQIPHIVKMGLQLLEFNT